MKFALVLLAFTALINTAKAQTSATVLVQDSTSHGSYGGLLSTSFVGLKLPSGGGNVYVTIAPGDSADGSYVTDYADHFATANYWYDGSSTSFNIGSTGHYWVYLATYGTTYNFDYIEVRVEASTYQGTVTCTYCAPPTGWATGWPPLGSAQETGVVHVSSQSGSVNPNMLVPRWVIPVLAVVIAIAALVPISYCIYRRQKNKKAMASSLSLSCDESTMGRSTSSSVELQTTSVV